MRATLPLLALLACSGFALAALPATCADPCDIPGSSFGYVPPAGIVVSGTAVTWSALDVTHVSGDGTGIGVSSTCFQVTYSALGASQPVVLEIVGGALYATTQDSNGDPVSEECLTAEPLPDGSFALPYYCRLHPQMKGVLVVTPA